MAALPIVMYPNPTLRVKCKRVRRSDASIQKLIDDMIETLRDAEGLGLAAPQVGVPLRIFVAELPADHEEEHAGETFVVCNPEIVRASGEQTQWDGCLSLPGWTARAKRARTVSVKGQDRHGKELRLKVSGVLAFCFQHEIDHLDGVLYFDRVDPKELRRLDASGEIVEASDTPSTID